TGLYHHDTVRAVVRLARAALPGIGGRITPATSKTPRAMPTPARPGAMTSPHPSRSPPPPMPWPPTSPTAEAPTVSIRPNSPLGLCHELSGSDEVVLKLSMS